MIKKFLFLILNVILINLQIRAETIKPCLTEKECKDPNSNCKCYCAGVCKFRNKKSNDIPIYIKNDPLKHKCYCKQWDLDNMHKCIRIS